jgi:hypothetical protein
VDNHRAARTDRHFALLEGRDRTGLDTDPASF